MHILEELKERGLIKQTVYEEDLYKLLQNRGERFYIGFDPTADSLHIGHFVGILMAARMQKAGYKPIILMGGGTAMIGDPSGRTDLRRMMTRAEIDANIKAIQQQVSCVLDYTGENAAEIVNNADWLLKLNYVEFIRDIGANLSVNRMLTADCFKARMEKGLSFLEFNYMPMQAYDFLHLFREKKCRIQMGGDDQWSNILAGADLIRRKAQEDAFAFTFPLLLTSEGKKMGKTAKGAVWIAKHKTSPYDLFQYFRNIDDADVETCYKMLTFFTLPQITEKIKGNINKAKEILAHDIVKTVHGKDEADLALSQAQAAFGGSDENALPTVQITAHVGDRIANIMVTAAICTSTSEARRLIESKSVRIDDEIISDVNAVLTHAHMSGFVLHKGKKVHLKVEVKK